MPNLRLRHHTVDAIPFSQSGQVFYRDTLPLGFGLRVGTKTEVYLAEKQMSRPICPITISHADLFAPEIAREKALAPFDEMVEGNSQKGKEAGNHDQAHADQRIR